MVRVAHVVASYHPRHGPVETHVRRLAEACASAGDEVTVLTHAVAAAPAVAEAGGVRVLRFPETVRWASLPLSRYLAEHARDFDVVHAHGYCSLAGHAAAHSGLPFVFTPHYQRTGHSLAATLLRRAYRPAGVWVLAKADAVICRSQAERDLMVDDLLTVARKIRVIPDGTAHPGSTGFPGSTNFRDSTGCESAAGQARLPSWADVADRTRELYAWAIACDRDRVVTQGWGCR